MHTCPEALVVQLRQPGPHTLAVSAAHGPLHAFHPRLQLNPHVDAAHVAIAFGAPGHAFVQLPQCIGSVAVDTQLPEQFVSPAGH
jgi:hypothetical protein